MPFGIRLNYGAAVRSYRNCFARCDVFQSAAQPLATGNLRAFNRNQNSKRRSAFPCATLSWSALLTGSLSKNARASAIEA
jgi:hypothetical protein